MTWVLAVLRSGLAATFLLAAGAKLADRRGFARTLADFRVPARMIRPLVLGLPVLELAITLALIPTRTARPAAAVATMTVAIFTVPVGVALLAGQAPACRCFGSLATAPISRATLARNAALVVAASAVALLGPGAELTAWLAHLQASEAVVLGVSAMSLLVAAAASLAALTLLRQYGRLLLRIDALEGAAAPSERLLSSTPGAEFGVTIGALAPRMTGAAADGAAVALEDVAHGRDATLLVFSDTRCGACSSLLPHVAAWQRLAGPSTAIALVVSGDQRDVAAEREEHGLRLVFVDDGQTARAFGIPGTPSAVLLDAAGAVRQTGAGADAVAGLALTALNAGRRVPPRIGDPVPAVALPVLGIDVPRTLDTQAALIILWDPACPACVAGLSALRDWDAQPNFGTPQLVVSRGAAEENHALGLKCPVLLDANHTVTHLLGARGTPSAVLIDGGGRIASGIAEGMAAMTTLRSSVPDEVPSMTIAS